jgi:hypothetical protein
MVNEARQDIDRPEAGYHAEQMRFVLYLFYAPC